MRVLKFGANGYRIRKKETHYDKLNKEIKFKTYCEFSVSFKNRKYMGEGWEQAHLQE